MCKNNQVLKLFLQEEYAFRRNLLSGKIEFCERKDAGTSNYRTLTREEMNSIILAAEEALPEAKGLRGHIETLVNSRLTPDYDPVREWLQALPRFARTNGR